MAILECSHVTKTFGSLAAVNDLSLSVREKEILAVVGPNGSGKTTFFNVVSKVTSPDRGTITFLDRRIDKLPPHKICHLGLARTFQVPAFFNSMTVWEQVLLAAKFGGRNLHSQDVTEDLNSVGLGDAKANKPTHSLNLYDKKKLMIATALAVKPKLLMLDEPLAGLNNQEVSEDLKLFAKIRDSGVTVMIIEHNIRALFAWADRAVVLNRGEKLAEGSPAEVSKDTQVVKVYLGEGYF